MLTKINRTLLEMQIGIVFVGIVLSGQPGAFFVKNQGLYAGSSLVGIALAMVSAFHMYRSLDRAIENEETARKRIFTAYPTRYVLFAFILFMIMITGVLNPLVVFMGYMSLKVTAFLQPVTHKLCIKLENLKKRR